MAVDLKLSMKLGQQMVMTPQLQAAIKLLQMNRLELSETIQAELMENPLLEESSDMSELDQKKADIEAEQSSSEKVDEVKPATDKDPDFDWDAYLEQSFSYTGKSASGLGHDPNQEEGPGFEAMASRQESLAEHLVEQLHLAEFSEEEKEIATVLIGAFDEWGYLKEPVEEIARRNNFDPEQVDLVLKLIQEFDPPGVGARDLKECLLLQLKQMKFRFKSHRELLRQIIEDHLQHLEKKNFKAIAKAMDLEMDELGEVIEMLQHFEPRPGRPFVEIENPYITPDIYIQKMNDEYVITMNEDGLPKLKISNLYRNILQQMPEAKKILQTASSKSKESVEEELATLIENTKPADGGESKVAEAVKPAAPEAPIKEDPRSYIQGKLRGALWLIRSIHQRQRTIYKVTESIIKNQREFLEQGVTHLRPMVLKDIAADIGMHESTISRVTSNKYVHTPQGIFELKFFFSSAIQRTNGDDIAAESVKEKIRIIVRNEDESKPISDQGIVELLRKQGIEIARRTVAKYREVLGILPSSQRKSLVKNKGMR
ncbi:MAG: RNA polymerase sigma-54 factor [Deltaproteobacteria bacterium CG11_big_fil_rev_8_21_14_0_20_45_16]|nr:MAG: RNA polymerase sigma-54 factor [Deltaproteobacteria bacterium CG11_big_fil_rev_8_21_14_0_20_45_16]